MGSRGSGETREQDAHERDGGGTDGRGDDGRHEQGGETSLSFMWHMGSSMRMLPE